MGATEKFIMASGVRIPAFGKKRHAMSDKWSNVPLAVINALLNMKIMVDEDFPDSKLIISAANSVLQIKAPSSSGAGSVSIKRMSITALFGDYVTCTKWDEDDASFTGASVNVAKPPELRNSIVSEGSVTFAYTDTNNRTATQAGYDQERHRVIPTYGAGNEIFALDTGELSGVTTLTWIDINVAGRVWSAVPIIPIP
jgi:hypothetical protein